MNIEFPLYHVNFSVDGSIIVEKQSTQTENVFMFKYPDLTVFLCACAINDGEIPDTDKVYREVRETYNNTCLTEDGEFNDIAINMSDSDTVGRRVALRSFYSLPHSSIKFLQNEYNYFPDATFVLEKILMCKIII